MQLINRKFSIYVILWLRKIKYSQINFKINRPIEKLHQTALRFRYMYTRVLPNRPLSPLPSSSLDPSTGLLTYYFTPVYIQSHDIISLLSSASTRRALLRARHTLSPSRDLLIYIIHIIYTRSLAHACTQQQPTRTVHPATRERVRAPVSLAIIVRRCAQGRLLSLYHLFLSLAPVCGGAAFFLIPQRCAHSISRRNVWRVRALRLAGLFTGEGTTTAFNA